MRTHRNILQIYYDVFCGINYNSDKRNQTGSQGLITVYLRMWVFEIHKKIIHINGNHNHDVHLIITVLITCLIRRYYFN